jgi:hypothetical protein
MGDDWGAAVAAFTNTLKYAGYEEVIGGGPEDPAADVAAVATVAVGAVYSIVQWAMPSIHPLTPTAFTPTPAQPVQPAANTSQKQASPNSASQANGARRENRIPDTGVPNSTATNPSGTTVKKYGPDGVVQKEYNQGHQQTKSEAEKTDYVHDHIPKPNSHPKEPQKTDRQPGRAPKKNELLKDFGIKK